MDRASVTATDLALTALLLVSVMLLVPDLMSIVAMAASWGPPIVGYLIALAFAAVLFSAILGGATVVRRRLTR